MMKDVIVGIDLGTTNSEVAVVREGRVEMIPVSPEGPILPSVVGIAPGGDLLVGVEAKNQATLYPERTILSVKRRMGEIGKIPLGEREFTPPEISALILGRLKQAAESYLGQSVSKAVITVPAFFSDAQRQATREAGEIAGLEVVRILNEPTAAALAYEKRVGEARKVVVYDLGGGTFDVSVVNIERGVVEVMASHGNNFLGGDDFDRKIQLHLLDHIKTTWGADLSGDRGVLSRLRRASEEVKRLLSDRPFGTVSEEFLFERDGLPVHLTLELSRQDYETMISDYIEETINAVRVALSNASLPASAIDEILLVGGSTRTPLVWRRLEEEFGREPRVELNPDLCVAMGAAIQASRLAGEEVGQVLVDVTPRSFGISAMGNRDGDLGMIFVPLIRRNTPIPVTKSEAFLPFHDGQKAVQIEVLQGESLYPEENAPLGSVMLEGLADRAHNDIVVNFSLDADGILQISAREKATGLERSLVIERAVARAGEEELERSRNRVAELLGDEGIPGEALPKKGEREAELLSRARDLLAKLEGADREDLAERIGEVEAVREGSEAELSAACDALEDLIFFLGH
jgi:molecular chaperone DnaK (HSP70)